MKIIISNMFLKALCAFVFAITLFIGGQAKAESRPTASNPLGYIGSLGAMTFGQSGGAFLPMSVIGAMKDGKISPVMQFVAMNHMMDGCIVDTVKRGKPGQREPYVVANAKFVYGICKIKKCFNQAMLVSLLSAQSENESAGADEGNEAFGLAFAQATQKDPSCDGQDDENGGMDPMLLMAFMGKR
jgi:hypothetical protein